MIYQLTATSEFSSMENLKTVMDTIKALGLQCTVTTKEGTKLTPDVCLTAKVEIQEETTEISPQTFTKSTIYSDKKKFASMPDAIKYLQSLPY